MIRRILLVLGLLPGLALVTGAARLHPAPPATTVSMTLHMAGGTHAMSHVPVTVYYLPFDPRARFTLHVMARATTNAAGQFTATLNTAMVPRTGLADVGSGPDAFNTEVIAVAPSRQIVASDEVLQLGHAVTASASAIMNPDTGKPELAGKVAASPGHPANSAAQIGTSYRWIPVLAMNSARGMHVNFAYTYDTSTAKQTEAGTAVSVEGDTSTSFGPFTASASSTESTDRSLKRHWLEANGYHKIIWVRYKWVEDQIIACNKFGCTTTNTWSIDHWQGSIGQYNPDLKCVRFKRRHHHRRCVARKVIGVVEYHPPAFKPSNCPQNFCLTTLSKQGPDFERDTVNTHMYSFQLGVAGFLGLESQGAYGTITSVTWNWKKGCSGGRQRVLWGYKNDPFEAPILQASCMKVPRQN